MIFIPWMLAAVISMMDPGMMKPMFTTTQGQVLLVIVGVLEVVGWLVIRRLVAIDV